MDGGSVTALDVATTGSSIRDVGVVERRAAATARAYHERVARPLHLESRRSMLASFAREFYERRLHIPISPSQRESLTALTDPDSLVIQVAHDGQLPHLGIVRMVLKAHEIARADGRASVVYLVGNHYAPEQRPDNVHYGMPLRGKPPEEVKRPPKIPIGQANARRPFSWLAPPTADHFASGQRQLAQFIDHNLAYERERGTPISRGARVTMKHRLEEVFEVLRRAAAEVASMGDWLVRVQHDFLGRMLPEESHRILFLPTAELTQLVLPDLRAIAASSEIARLKAEISARQSSRGEEPYQRGPERSAFWAYCRGCGRRFRTPWTGDVVEFRCPKCGTAETLSGASMGTSLMPDVVAYEAAVLRLGFDGWIVGSDAPYQAVIEGVYESLFRAAMAPRFFLVSRPVFRGIGDPLGGHPRTRLVRALIEGEPAALARALSAPWEESPRIVSDFLKDER